MLRLFGVRVSTSTLISGFIPRFRSIDSAWNHQGCVIWHLCMPTASSYKLLPLTDYERTYSVKDMSGLAVKETIVLGLPRRGISPDLKPRCWKKTGVWFPNPCACRTPVVPRQSNCSQDWSSNDFIFSECEWLGVEEDVEGGMPAYPIVGYPFSSKKRLWGPAPHFHHFQTQPLNLVFIKRSCPAKGVSRDIKISCWHVWLKWCNIWPPWIWKDY